MPDRDTSPQSLDPAHIYSLKAYAEVAEESQGARGHGSISVSREKVLALCAMALRDTKDAERYRWLRDQSDRDLYGNPYVNMDQPCPVFKGEDVTVFVEGADLDAAIDAARVLLPKQGPVE